MYAPHISLPAASISTAGPLLLKSEILSCAKVPLTPTLPLSIPTVPTPVRVLSIEATVIGASGCPIPVIAGVPGRL